MIEREEGQNQAIKIVLDDNGASSDQIQNDGIYSKYFSQYDGINGRYTLKCQAKGHDETIVVTQKKWNKICSKNRI